MMTPREPGRWLNRTVIGIGLASLCSDWSHEIASTLLPAFLATMGAAAAWLGLIEGVADGVASFTKMASGYYTDRWARRKPIAVFGYVLTAVGTASIGLANSAWQVLLARAGAWLGRGVRTPVRKALLAAAVTRESYGRAFGFERMMDTFGAIIGPLTALLLLQALRHDYARIYALTLIPGLAAAVLMAFAVQERSRTAVSHLGFALSVRALPAGFRRLLVAVGLFGLGDFAHTMLILLAVQKLLPVLGAARAATVATGLYVLHNVLYAAFAMIGGALADRLNKVRLLALAYLLAAAMAVAIMFLPLSAVDAGGDLCRGRHLRCPGGDTGGFAVRRTGQRRASTASHSARWRRSMGSVTCFRAWWSAGCGRCAAHGWHLPTARPCLSPAA